MNFLLQVEHTLDKIVPKNKDHKHCRLLRKNSKSSPKMLSMIIRQSKTQYLQLKIFRQEHRAKKRLQK